MIWLLLPPEKVGSRLHTVAKLNLDRLQQARAENIMFEESIIQWYDIPGIPEHCRMQSSVGRSWGTHTLRRKIVMQTALVPIESVAVWVATS